MAVYQEPEGLYDPPPLEDVKLKPCPFCGSDSRLSLVHTHTAVYWVECECGAQQSGTAVQIRRRSPSKGELIRARASAVEAWNTREGG